MAGEALIKKRILKIYSDDEPGAALIRRHGIQITQNTPDSFAPYGLQEKAFSLRPAAQSQTPAPIAAPAVSPAPAFRQPILDAAKQTASLARQAVQQPLQGPRPVGTIPAGARYNPINPMMAKQPAQNFWQEAFANIASIPRKVDETTFEQKKQALAAYPVADVMKKQALEKQLAAFPQDAEQRRALFLQSYAPSGQQDARGDRNAAMRSRAMQKWYAAQKEDEYQRLLREYMEIDAQARWDAFTKETGYVLGSGNDAARAAAEQKELEYQQKAQELLKAKAKVLAYDTSVDDLLRQKEAYTPEQVATINQMVSNFNKQHPGNWDLYRRAGIQTKMTPEERAQFTAILELQRRVNPLSAGAAGALDGATFGLGKMLIDSTRSSERFSEMARAARKLGDGDLAKVYEAMAQGNNGIKSTERDARQHPFAYGAGNFIGSGIGYSGAAKIVSSIPRVGQVAQAAGQKISGLTGGRISAEVATGLVSGRIADLPGDVTNAAIETIENGDNFYDFVKKLAGDQAAGLLMDGSIEMLSAGYRMIKQRLGKGADVKMAAPAAPQNLRDLPNQNPDYYELIKKKPVKVVDLPEIGEVKDYKALRNDLAQYARDNGYFDKPVINKDTGVPVFITNKALKHSMNNAGDMNKAQVEILPQLIENAVFVGKNYPKSKDALDALDGSYTLLSAVRQFDDAGEYYVPVKLTVKEFNVSKTIKLGDEIQNYFLRNGNSDYYSRLYDSRLLTVASVEKIEGPVPKYRPNGSINPNAGIFDTNPIISIEDLLGTVKGKSEKYLPTPNGPGTHQANTPVPPPDRMPPPTQGGGTGGGGIDSNHFANAGKMSAKEANDLAGQQFAQAAIDGMKKGGLEQRATREANEQAARKIVEAIKNAGQGQRIDGLEEIQQGLSNVPLVNAVDGMYNKNGGGYHAQTVQNRQQDILSGNLDFAGDGGKSGRGDTSFDTRGNGSFPQEPGRIYERPGDGGRQKRIRTDPQGTGGKGEAREYFGEVTRQTYTPQQKKLAQLAESRGCELHFIGSDTTNIDGEKVNMKKMRAFIDPDTGRIFAQPGMTREVITHETIHYKANNYPDETKRLKREIAYLLDQNGLAFSHYFERAKLQHAEKFSFDRTMEELICDMGAIVDEGKENMKKRLGPFFTNEKTMEDAITIIQKYNSLPYTNSLTDSQLHKKMNPNDLHNNEYLNEKGSYGKNTVGAAQSETTPERKVSKLYSNSFEKTPLFNEAEKNAAHLRRLDKTYSYDEITEKRSLREAAMRVQTDKAAELADLPVKGEWGGSDVDTAMLLMEDMLKTARQTKNYDEVLKWTKMIQEKATVAGQEIQAFAKYSRTPEGAAVKAQKVVADHWKKLADTNPHFVKAMDDLAENLSKIAKEYAYDLPEDPIEAAKKLRKAIKEVCADGKIKLDQTGQEKILQALLERHEGKDVYEDVLKQLEGVPILTGEEINQIMDIMSEAEKFPLYSRKRAQIENQANCIVAGKFSSNWTEKFTAWRYMAMLGNSRTHIRNTLGNGLFGVVTKTKNAVGALLEEATDRASKTAAKLRKSGEGGIQRTKAILNPFNKGDQALKKAAKADYEDFWALVAGTGKYNPADAIRDNKRIFKHDVLEKSRKFVSDALEAEDNWALRARYAENMASYLKANKFNADVFKSNSPIAQNILDKARAYAIEQAQKATFRDASAVASALNKFSNSSKAAHIVVEGILPFKKTPINIIKRGAEYSPIGVVQGMGRIFNAVRKGKYNASDAIEKIASGLTGSGIMAIGVWLAHEGAITGAGSSDGRERAFDTLTGGQNYALVIGDKQYSLEWASPAALPLFVGVEMQKAWTAKKGEYGFSELMDALTKISEPVLDMTMLQGLNDTLETAAYNQTNALAAIVGSAATNYITQFVPSAFGHAARTADATRRSTADDKTNGIPGFIEKPARAVMAKTPGLSYLLEPSIDQWGREKQNAGGNVVGRLALNTLSPGFYSQKNKTPVDLEIERLYKKTGKKEILPDYANKYIMQEGKRRDLNAKEYTQFAKEKGQNAFKALDALFKSDHYKGMDEKKQAETIQDIYTYAGDLAASKVIGKPLKGWMAKAEEAEKQGISTDKFILYRNALKDLKTSAEKNQALLDDNATIEEKKALYLAFVPGSDTSVQKAEAKIQAFKTAGLDMDDFLEMSVKYAEIDGQEGLSPQNKTTQFCKWLDTQGLSKKQYQTAQENFKYFSMFPAKPEAYKVEFTGDKTQNAFVSLQKKYGIKEKDFMRGINAADTATSDKDKNGKTVSGSLKMNRYTSLRKLGWNHAAAKVFLMEVYGYKDKDWT